MADIQKCWGEKYRPDGNNEVCPKRERCYRYTAPSGSIWQAFGPVPFEKVGRQTVCRDYWDTRERNNDKARIRLRSNSL